MENMNFSKTKKSICNWITWKRIRKLLLHTSTAAGCVFLVMLIYAYAYHPTGDAITGLFFGNVYCKQGEAVFYFQESGKTESLNIYKAKDKPFLIVGPYWFGENSREAYRDFFFIRKNGVITSSVDMCGESWAVFLNLLFIASDFSGNVNSCITRTDWRFHLPSEKATVRYDPETDMRIYSIRIYYNNTPVVFSIPEKLFTPDMEAAETYAHEL